METASMTRADICRDGARRKAAMRIYWSIGLAERFASLVVAPMRAFAGSFGLAVFLLFFAGSADAACTLRLYPWMVRPLTVTKDDAFETQWRSFGYKYDEQSPVCSIAVNWPIHVAMVAGGRWNKQSKTASESISVKVSTQFSQASYHAITTRKCMADPWREYEPVCASKGSKQVASKGWKTSLIPWSGVHYPGALYTRLGAPWH
jgi:hypothetical protein